MLKKNWSRCEAWNRPLVRIAPKLKTSDRQRWSNFSATSPCCTRLIRNHNQFFGSWKTVENVDTIVKLSGKVAPSLLLIFEMPVEHFYYGNRHRQKASKTLKNPRKPSKKRSFFTLQNCLKWPKWQIKKRVTGKIFDEIFATAFFDEYITSVLSFPAHVSGENQPKISCSQHQPHHLHEAQTGIYFGPIAVQHPCNTRYIHKWNDSNTLKSPKLSNPDNRSRLGLFRRLVSPFST